MNTQKEYEVDEKYKAYRDHLAQLESEDEVELAARWERITEKEFKEQIVMPPASFQGESFVSGEPLTVGVEGYLADVFTVYKGKRYTRPGYVLDFNPEWYALQIEALERKAPVFLPFSDFDKKRYTNIGTNHHACKTFVVLEGKKRFVEIVIYEFTDTNTVSIHFHSDPINNAFSGFAAYVKGNLQTGLRLICELDLNNLTWAQLRASGFDYLFG